MNTDQLASQQTVDQDIHCFQNRIYLDLAWYANVINQVLYLVYKGNLVIIRFITDNFPQYKYRDYLLICF